MVLPGVFINDAMWNSCSSKTKEAINQFLSLLTFSITMKEGTGSDFGLGGDAFRKWADTFMDDWRGKMNRTEFDSFTKRFSDLFGSTAASGERLPPFPEKLRKGKLVKLAEEIVKELKMEDFGIDPATMESAGNDPTKALGIIMELLTKNPAALQNTIGKLTKKIQSKIQSGAIRPSELVAEAEELMKTFSENPQFVGLMESFRQSFGAFNDPDVARATNREPENRLNIVKERLRKKLEARKNGKK
jgi:hypothetical protein